MLMVGPCACHDHTGSSTRGIIRCDVAFPQHTSDCLNLWSGLINVFVFLFFACVIVAKLVFSFIYIGFINIFIVNGMKNASRITVLHVIDLPTLQAAVVHPRQLPGNWKLYGRWKKEEMNRERMTWMEKCKVRIIEWNYSYLRRPFQTFRWYLYANRIFFSH